MDTERRSKELEAKGIIYIGTGVSGGEQGALWGPAIMPGGQPEAWELVKPIFEAISAKAQGEPCVAYMGPRGAGHYVKMVHNGIEYGDMQLIAETYDILHRGLGLDNDRLHEVFAEWNKVSLESHRSRSRRYLHEASRDGRRRRSNFDEVQQRHRQVDEPELARSGRADPDH
jgi:6-phosphogluconate dehydrogenase